MRRLASLLLLVALAIAGLITVLLVALTDSEPIVRRDETISPQAIAQARWLFLMNDPRRLREGELRTLPLPVTLLDDGVNYLASRRLPARGAFQLQPEGAIIRISLRLPMARYANLTLHLGSRAGRPQLTSARLGSLRLPATLIETLAAHALQQAGYGQELDMAGKALKSVVFDAAHQRVLVSYAWEPALLDRARAIALDTAATARLKNVQESLAGLLAHHAAGSRLPLTQVLGPLLRARDRDERRAVLLALSAYLAGKNLDGIAPQAADWPRPRPVVLMLLGRHDSAQHFVISAALAAWAGEPVANAIGVYKELADARRGSGFSFADLAADRAGTRFGELLNTNAPRLDALLADELTDDGIVPPLADLPEYLAEPEFRHRYRDLQSPAYRALTDEIERRLDALPLYQPAH